MCFIKKQLSYLYSKTKEQKNVIKSIIEASNSGSDYLKPFVENDIYLAWAILGAMTLGPKLQVFSKLKNVNNFLTNPFPYD